MGDPKGFLRYPRKDPGYRPAEDRVKDFEQVELSLTERELREQAARCMDCGIPFCHGYGCPLSNIIPEFNELIERGRWQDALDMLLETNPFPEFTGRICPAPCEAACVNGLDGEPVTIRQVELAIIEKGFQEGYLRSDPPKQRRDERVAIIGSGPAGLAVADTLNKAGVQVVVFDAARRAGGILRYGIPDFKLEKRIVDRRIDLMKEEGILFEMGVRVGDDVSYRYLKDRFDAICLTGGARQPRDLTVPGRELRGIHFAMEYLTQQNRKNAGEPVGADEEITARGKSVVVIGGGDTGSDCLGTAIRQGARRVLQYEILPEPPPARDEATPWPHWPHTLRESSSHKEGGTRRWSVLVKEFLGEQGQVAGLRGVEVTWQASEEGGVPVICEQPETAFEEEVDLVLLAMGFTGFKPNRVIDDLGLEADNRGAMVRDENHMTNVPGVFVAGDMALGASLVVRAIADGIATARSIVRYLEPKPGS
jgi:glutamate synthase (NADPH/NADH) small chain